MLKLVYLFICSGEHVSNCNLFFIARNSISNECQVFIPTLPSIADQSLRLLEEKINYPWSLKEIGKVSRIYILSGGEDGIRRTHQTFYMRKCTAPLPHTHGVIPNVATTNSEVF